MLVREIKEVAHPERMIEIANRENYFYGKAKNIPDDLLDYVVTYIAAGPSDTTSEDNCLLLDAERR